MTPPKWSGNSNTYSSQASNWIQSQTILTGAAGQSNVRFRMRFASDGGGVDEGWAIDNIEIVNPAVPTVTTNASSNITTSNARLDGTITANGGAVVTSSGVVIGISPSPSKGDPGVIDSVTTPFVGSGSFHVDVTGLSSATTYHYRAYAVNGVGVSYGADSTFTTNASATVPNVQKKCTGYRYRVYSNNWRKHYFRWR